MKRWPACSCIAGGNAETPTALALAADLGFYLVVPDAAEPMPPGRLASRACMPSVFADDLRDHLPDSDLLRLHFARVAQTGLMVLRNPLGRKRKVGGKDWTERRLFEQIRGSCRRFRAAAQAEREAVRPACDLAAAPSLSSSNWRRCRSACGIWPSRRRSGKACCASAFQSSAVDGGTAAEAASR